MSNCIEKIKEYLHDDSMTYPLFVNVENAEQKSEIYDYCNVSGNTIVHVSDFAKKDSIPNVMALIDRIKKSPKNIFVFELTTYLRLIGNKELENTLQMLCGMSIQKKAVIICYHCEEVLKSLIQKDLRVAQRVATVDDIEEMKKPKVVFIKPEYELESISAENGIEHIAKLVEANTNQEVYLKTTKSPKVFEKGLYAISMIDNPLQILKNKFMELCSFKYKESDSAYWDYLLKLSYGKQSFKAIVIDHFGNDNSFEYALQEWNQFDDKKQWLLFIAMKVFPDGQNRIIRKIVSDADSHLSLQKAMMRSILDYSYTDENYPDLYRQWKSLRFRINVPGEEVSDFCEFVDQKGKDALYYLTDLTKQEKEKAIKVLGQYQAEYSDAELLKLLKSNFPDFFDYVSPFFFNNELLDSYFSKYNIQKIRNVIYPEFEALVEKEAINQDVVELPTRAEIVSGLNKEDSVLFFVDALGVEFLNYILKKCSAKRLFAEPKVAKCNLPSITEFNKEFLDDFKSAGADVVDKIKKIDEDKHKAIGDYSFEKTHYPIHLIDELETIDQILANVASRLGSNKYKQAYIISDHGASRLAVLKKHTLPIKSNRTGNHGGRVCEENELTKNLPHAIHEGNFCIMAGYDLFDGSRPAAVETHGGATIEEMVVPIIKITKNNTEWEFKVMNENQKVYFSYKTEPILVIWSKTELTNMMITIDGVPYTGKSNTDKKTFCFTLPKPDKAKNCLADIYVSNNCVKKHVSFRLEREGMQKNSSIGLGGKTGGFSKK